MKKILLLGFLLMVNYYSFSQYSTMKDSLIRYLIAVEELDTIHGGNSIIYYRDAIHIVTIQKCNTNHSGIYQFGANTDHGNEFAVIVQNDQMKILTGPFVNDIEEILNFFDEYKSCFNNNDLARCLRIVIDINNRNNYRKTNNLW